MLGLGYIVCLPKTLFAPVYSTVLEDRNGQLLGAAIASDGQWRFPASDSVDQKFVAALVAFEDKRFFQHHGIDVRSLARAIWQNLENGRIISGGSTLSMQVIRLSRQKSRTIPEKLWEMILATRLEWRYSKEEILQLYAAHAPFGGNVVGLEAAAWRYYGRPPQQLTWAESAALAVLPNAPALVFPGRNSEILKRKRDRVLDKLHELGHLDSLSCALSKDEALPGKPLPLPQLAPRLLTHCIREGKEGQRIATTLDANLQRQAKTIVNRHHARLQGNQIFNAAALILEVESGATLAYVGNADMVSPEKHGGNVDIIQAPRSTGSILKPFLYAGMLHEGTLLPEMLLPDIPTVMRGFAPQNFNKEYEGAVPAKRALARSLNIPAVRMLQSYGVPKFHQLLNNMGFTGITQSPNHYGLSLILGGAEASLWDITGAYASMSRSLKRYFRYPEPNRYSPADWHSPHFEQSAHGSESSNLKNSSILHAGAMYQTFQAMLEVYRPDAEANWQRFSSSTPIAWKTGTSYGFRDAWAVGVTPEYAVGIWTGNANGEGRPGLVGISAAGPLLFELFDMVPATSWFDIPNSDLKPMATCRESGFRLGLHCPTADTLLVPITASRAAACTYHQPIQLDPTETYRVHSDCESISQMIQKKWFVLPPAMEWYYKSRSSTYRTLPPWRSDCATIAGELSSPMELIYPKNEASLFIPRGLDGVAGKVVFEVAHQRSQLSVHWHLDESYLGSTDDLHIMELQPNPGNHILTLVDDNGAILTYSFEVLDRVTK